MAHYTHKHNDLGESDSDTERMLCVFLRRVKGNTGLCQHRDLRTGKPQLNMKDNFRAPELLSVLLKNTSLTGGLTWFETTLLLNLHHQNVHQTKQYILIIKGAYVLGMHSSLHLVISPQRDMHTLRTTCVWRLWPHRGKPEGG